MPGHRCPSVRGERVTATARPSPGPSRAALLLVPVLAAALSGCAVETVQSDIADQQLCVAAQPVVEAVRARGSVTGKGGDLRDLAARAADPELRATLTDLGKAYADATGDGPGSAAWAEADRVAAGLDQVCRRLSAF